MRHQQREAAHQDLVRDAVLDLDWSAVARGWSRASRFSRPMRAHPYVLVRGRDAFACLHALAARSLFLPSCAPALSTMRASTCVLASAAMCCSSCCIIHVAMHTLALINICGMLQDGAQTYLKEDGVSIPQEYTSYLAPITSTKLHGSVMVCHALQRLLTASAVLHRSCVARSAPRIKGSWRASKQHT